MATEQQAHDTQKLAFAALNKFGTVVLAARAKERDDGWYVEVEVARTDRQTLEFEIGDVPILVVNRNHAGRSPRPHRTGLTLHP